MTVWIEKWKDWMKHCDNFSYGTDLLVMVTRDRKLVHWADFYGRSGWITGVPTDTEGALIVGAERRGLSKLRRRWLRWTRR